MWVRGKVLPEHPNNIVASFLQESSYRVRRLKEFVSIIALYFRRFSIMSYSLISGLNGGRGFLVLLILVLVIGQEIIAYNLEILKYHRPSEQRKKYDDLPIDQHCDRKCAIAKKRLDYLNRLKCHRKRLMAYRKKCWQIARLRMTAAAESSP